MKKLLIAALAAGLTLGTTGIQAGTPQEGIKAAQDYFAKKFPKVNLADLKDGSYALDENKRINYEGVMEFPPFEDLLAQGEEIWNTKFANGNSFASCFGDDPSKVRARFPHWNAKDKQVETLEGNIVKCQEANGEKPFGLKKGKIAYLSAWLGSQANGQKVNVVIPDDPDAIAAWKDGEKFFWKKRGQLSMACSDCHVGFAGGWIRGNLLSPAVGQTTHFPVWRGKWAKKGDGFGTLHRRYGGCNKQVRAKPFKAQGKEYSNMEFYHASLSNGLEIQAPDYRE